MKDDGLEVLDVDDDVQARLDSKILEVGGINCDCGDEWMLQDFLPICDLLGVALEHTSPVVSSKDVEHLGLGTEVLDVLFDGTRMQTPSVFGNISIEECMHDIDSLVGELVCLDHALIADHLHDEPALRFVVSLLYADFASIYGAIPS